MSIITGGAGDHSLDRGGSDRFGADREFRHTWFVPISAPSETGFQLFVILREIHKGGARSIRKKGMGR
jgi:hypothetical protein